ncbi:hypothetical protein Cni_G16210 [Canna indica]|uniref:Uncharacterized protein n=1 Tax=Canna indica TaxID=4628 RepID=A0AAQ3QE01_9LILI|nr:hypothetical protein Cni_G16210 [Canna indica]
MSSPWGGSRPDPAAVGVSASAWPGRSLSSGRRRAAKSSPAPTTSATPHSTVIVSLAPAVAPPTTTVVPAPTAIPTPTTAPASPTTGERYSGSKRRVIKEAFSSIWISLQFGRW